jgi:hypothetical protein
MCTGRAVGSVEIGHGRRVYRELNPGELLNAIQLTFGVGNTEPAAKRSDQRILPVACITTSKVTMAIIVMASPVNPFQKKAQENRTR